MDCLKLAREGLFQDTEEEDESVRCVSWALLHIRTSAFYPSHPQIIPAIFLRSLPVQTSAHPQPRTSAFYRRPGRGTGAPAPSQ